MADHPVPGTSKLYDDLQDEIAKVNLISASSEEQMWQLFFDGALRMNLEGNIIVGVMVVTISPHKYVIPRVFSPTKCVPTMSQNTTLF